MAAKTDKKDKKIPLKWRLIAWWEGFDPADIEERMRLRELEKNAGKKKNPPSQKKKIKNYGIKPALRSHK